MNANIQNRLRNAKHRIQRRLDALGTERIPDPTTAGDFCRRSTEGSVTTRTCRSSSGSRRFYDVDESDHEAGVRMLRSAATANRSPAHSFSLKLSAKTTLAIRLFKD